MRIGVLTFVALLVAGSTVEANPVTWIATNKTAMSITGDIALDEYSLTFKNGKSLDLEPYEQDRMGDWAGSGEKVAGYVYKIDPPSNPKLLRGNSLCGAPITYLVVWSPGEGELTLNVYSGDEAPAGDADADGLCATYAYEAP